MVEQPNVDELLHYKKTVLRDTRRESRIRDSIEQTLDYINNKRRSEFNLSFYDNTRPNSQVLPPAAGPAPVQPLQVSQPPREMSQPPPQYPNISGPMGLKSWQDMPNKYNDTKKDIEKLGVYDVPAPSHAGGGHGGGGHGHGHHEEVDPASVDWRERLKHFTFAWFASSMSLGGTAFVMSVIPNQQAMPWLRGLGTGLFVFNIIYFLTLTSIMVVRLMMHPGTLKKALANPHEGFFFATFWLTIATMITNTTAYGVPATGNLLIEPLRIAFWIYTFCVTILGIVYYMVLFNVKKLVITNVLPGWLLPIFPSMLVGTLASAIAKTQPPEQAYPMLIAGLTYQGLGMMMAMMIYAIYLGRLLTSGLPIDMSRPAMFIAVGPPAFTALALLGMSQDCVDLQLFTQFAVLPGISNPAIIYDVMQIGSLLAAIFLWMLAFWFFSIAVIATFEAIHRNDFHLNWYAYVFPNVGFTIATIQIGNRLASSAMQIVGTGMAATLLVLLIMIAFAHVKAFYNRMICWPGKDEDAH